MSFHPKILRTSPARFGIATVVAVGLLAAIPGNADAAAAPVPLGTTNAFVVLAGSGITNIGKTPLNGDIGTFPTPSVTGLSTVTLNGTDHAADPVTQGAKKDLTTAYTTAAGAQPTTAIPVELGGTTMRPGVYGAGALLLTGTLTLDGTGDPNAVFIFKASSSLVTRSNSRVNLINVNPCNVFWQVTSSATLGSGSKFVGTLMALTDIHLTTGATLDGRVLARNGAVTLQANTVTRATCKASSTFASPIKKPSATPSGQVSATPSGQVSATPSATPSGQVSGQVSVVPSGAVSTGDGSTAGENSNEANPLAGALVLTGAARTTIVACRRLRRNV